MAKLILSLDGQVLHEYELRAERTTIGRKAHNDIQIENLAVSGQHAVVTTILNDSFIEDLGSTNGTLVNGKPIKKHFLQNGDVIELGKHKLAYFSTYASAAASAPAEEADFEKTMIIRSVPKFDGADQRPAPVEAAAAAAAAPAVATTDARQPIAQPEPGDKTQALAAPQAGLQILNGASAGKELMLTKSLTSIGKPGVQVAVIARRPLGYYITHVQGASHPVLNGKELDAQAHQLNDHDVIELAGIKMEFFYKP